VSGRERVVQRRVVVGGRVQGVGFRYGVARRAEAAGVAGWVRNRDDGTVEAVLEGDAGAVARLVEWCRQGPRGALVDDVSVVDERPSRLRGFAVR
jgi:acylphosphatase